MCPTVWVEMFTNKSKALRSYALTTSSSTAPPSSSLHGFQTRVFPFLLIPFPNPRIDPEHVGDFIIYFPSLPLLSTILQYNATRCGW